MRRIDKLLIANRGEIAARIIRTCRDMGIATVAIYADPDRNAPFVRQADEAIYIGPPMASASFLAIEKIVELARNAGADAIHPGYGFLAENADFAQACSDAGLIFIGPAPEAIRGMGNKSAAKEIARAAGVPVIPGFNAEGLSETAMARQCEELGFPVLLKAAAGGGGKGMRVVAATADLPAAIAAARREAKAAFGDDALLVERYIESPRHIEVQILGDQHGKLIHCFERECSIQRRYQKIIEEAPSPAVDETLRQRMTEAALRLGARLRYSSLGTVEMVLDPAGSFYFLEVNTRLQVEHPVTEAVTGLDLVRLQIEVAEGAPLPLEQKDVVLRGHAIECRLCAEDPAREFLPSTGRLAAWKAPELVGVRCDTGVISGSEITIHYDSLIAKLIAYDFTRPAAARRMAQALRQTRVQGLASNRDLLLRIVESDPFLRGELDTHFLVRHGDLCDVSPQQTEIDRTHALAAALWQQSRRREQAAVLRTIPSGWRNSPSQMQTVVFEARGNAIAIGYQMAGNHRATATIDGAPHSVAVIDAEPDAIALEIDGMQRRFSVTEAADTCFVYS
ncbi:MAG TPA: biotin carboxylase N-terminal domain-containing protein, partial [Terriglobales bacterium]|nr:biotin carboxylase N-terminal domain-containing protein [Terriglobales bacterium]